MSYRGRGRGGGYHNNYNNNNGRNNYNHQNVDSYVTQNSIPIEIMGWNGASSEECINFISRKCKIVVMNHSVDSNTGILKGYVKTQDQANELLNWSGVKFAGQSLKFTKGTNSFSNKMSQSSGNSSNTIEVITQFIKSRYQPDIKLLNLSSVKHDPQLTSQGFFNSISTSSKFFPALMKIAGEIKLDVVSVDLSGNELTDLSSISTLAVTFPLLQNLSLQNNNLSRIKVFETWKRKLNFLRELLLRGNPLMNNVSSPSDVENIKFEVMRAFPRLIVVDGEILRNEQALNETLSFGFTDKSSMFFQDEEIRNMATNFISNYLKLWDSNRADLMVLYQAESQFSMQVDSSHPYIIETNANSNNGTDFGYYLSNSRNLTRVSSAKARVSRVAIGQEQIFKSFSQLPKTNHEILTKPENFSVESYRFPQLNGIMISIHGSFEELAKPDNTEGLQTSIPTGPRNKFNNHQKHKTIPLGKKSFDRTLVVIPGPNGAMIVASDLLLIRPYSSLDAWKQPQLAQQQQQQQQQQLPPHVNTPPPSAPPSSGSATIPPVSGIPGAIPGHGPSVADLPAEVKASLNPVYQELLVRIIVETKLTLQYGLMLCEQSHWDYQQCIVNFKNSMASLPREAYAP
ncbi:nuclear mRNA export, poly(A)+RNA binding protein [Scheffersomyces amazonensis]|uniref:nuclear mRNA export, poly(A)+RNA binding protein n=1 Tax=Scheffersomyces amazonensis TaxID=1078765 RepID=UPI00315DCD80